MWKYTDLTNLFLGRTTDDGGHICVPAETLTNWINGYTETPITGCEETTDAEGNTTLTTIYGDPIVHPPHTPEPADVPPPIVPQTVTRFQAMAALHLAGYLEAASAAVAQSGVMAKLAWDNAQSFERSSQTLASLASALGISDTQLDALFTQADQIKA